MEEKKPHMLQCYLIKINGTSKLLIEQQIDGQQWNQAFRNKFRYSQEPIPFKTSVLHCPILDPHSSMTSLQAHCTVTEVGFTSRFQALPHADANPRWTNHDGLAALQGMKGWLELGNNNLFRLTTSCNIRSTFCNRRYSGIIQANSIWQRPCNETVSYPTCYLTIIFDMIKLSLNILQRYLQPSPRPAIISYTARLDSCIVLQPVQVIDMKQWLQHILWWWTFFQYNLCKINVKNVS